MFFIATVTPPDNDVFIPFILAAIGLYCIYVGVKGLLEDDEEN